MKPERWVQIEALFNRAVECESDQRLQVLKEAGGTDPELRREVESLLSCYGSADAHLRAAVRGEAGAIGLSLTSENREIAFLTRTILSSDAVAEAAIGAYHLVELLGQGGMGEVWLAEQKQPVRRRVAIKLIKAGMDTREVVARFESERQALALMDHPAIAKVLDAGSTPAGRPYFVMEYVPGMPITDYCDKHKLTVPERLQLFIQVCEGVKHAHQKAIIHRDLKPSNILVTEVDDRAIPRIIDFGVAKAISQRLTENTLVTCAGALLGTPEYMSPEQADSAGEDIDTRTDVYSLGVILYELLVGTVPLDLRKLTFDEMLRKLRAEDAPRPSTKLRALGKQSAITAHNRRMEPKALIRQLHGDLDSIVLKALEKVRARRYGAPSELAADIERYLRHEPVTARPASMKYRAGKYIRRHRIGVTVAAGFVLLLATFSITEGLQIRRIKQERDRADTEAATAKAVTDFLRNDLLAASNINILELKGNQLLPDSKHDPDLRVRTVLDRAAAHIVENFATQPVVEASIRKTIGDAYLSLGLHPVAQAQLERALNLQRRVLGEEHADTLDTMSSLTWLYYDEGKYAQAETLCIKVLEIRRRVLGEEDSATLLSMYNLSALYRGQGKYAQAEPIQKGLVDDMLRVEGGENRNTLDAMGNLALLYDYEDKLAQSEALYRKVVDGLQRLEGKEDPDTLRKMNGLARAYAHEGKYAQSDALFSEVLETESRVLGKDHPYTLDAMSELAASYRRRGMYHQAEALLVSVLEGRRRKLGAGNPDTLASMGDLGWLYVTEGRSAEAKLLLREATDKLEKSASDDWERYRIMCALGASLAGQKQYARAEPLLVDGYQKMMERRATIPADGKSELEQAGERIVKMYQDWDKPEKAKDWQQKFEAAGLSIPPKHL